MNLNLNEYVNIREFAKLSGLTVRSLYIYRYEGWYKFPEPDENVGGMLFWKRSRAEAWARKPRGKRAA